MNTKRFLAVALLLTAVACNEDDKSGQTQVSASAPSTTDQDQTYLITPPPTGSNPGTTLPTVPTLPTGPITGSPGGIVVIPPITGQVPIGKTIKTTTSVTINEDASVANTLGIYTSSGIQPTSVLLPSQPVWSNYGFELHIPPKKGWVIFGKCTSTSACYFYYPFPNVSGKDSFMIRSGSNTNPATMDPRPVNVNVTINPVNDPPKIGGPSSIVAQAGDSISVIFPKSDEEGEAVTLTATGLPAGATFDGNTGLFSWTTTDSMVGDGTIVLTAKDAAATTTRSIPYKITPSRLPWLKYFDGKDTHLQEGITWDTAGSNVREVADSTNARLVFTLNNKNWWGSAGYSFASNQTVNLSSFKYLSFDAASSKTVNVQFFLVNYLTGKESVHETISITPNQTNYTLDLEKFSNQGFDLTKVTSLILAVSESATATYTVNLDNIIAIGAARAPRSYGPPSISLRYGGDNLAIAQVDSGLPQPGLVYSWTVHRIDKGYASVDTTVPTLDLTPYAAYEYGSLSVKTSIGGVEYTSPTIRLPDLRPASPPVYNYAAIEYADTDVMGNQGSISQKSTYENLTRDFWMARAAPLNTNKLNLLSVGREFQWYLGIIPYTFENLTADQQANVTKVMDEIRDTTGVIFVPAALYTPSDPVAKAVKPIRIRYMNVNDLGYLPNLTAAQKQALLDDRTCAVSPFIGNRATNVLLKPTGKYPCLGTDDYSVSTIRHELFHVMGAAHEQLADAAGVKLNYVYPWQESQFVANATFVTRFKYQPESIMHYRAHAFSICEETATVDGAPAWVYPDATLDAALQAKINAMQINECKRNANWEARTDCYQLCKTILNGPIEVPVKFHPDDLKGMFNLYQVNRKMIETMLDNKIPTQSRIELANILGNLRRLNLEAVADPTLIDRTFAHKLASLLLPKYGIERTVSEGCTSAGTDPYNGRRSCTTGSQCIVTANQSSVFLPGVKNRKEERSGEASCTFGFAGDGGTFCVTGTARGLTTIGTTGSVKCSYTVTEVDFGSPKDL